MIRALKNFQSNTAIILLAYWGTVKRFIAFLIFCFLFWEAGLIPLLSVAFVAFYPFSGNINDEDEDDE